MRPALQGETLHCLPCPLASPLQDAAQQHPAALRLEAAQPPAKPQGARSPRAMHPGVMPLGARIPAVKRQAVKKRPPCTRSRDSFLWCTSPGTPEYKVMKLHEPKYSHAALQAAISWVGEYSRAPCTRLLSTPSLPFRNLYL